MTGGLIELVAYGVQDVFLTGNPQITFFKLVYKRYTNFAQEEFEQAFSGPLDFSTRNEVIIARRGDLMTNMTLEIDLRPLTLSMTCDFDTMADALREVTFLAQAYQRTLSTITSPLLSTSNLNYLLHVPIDSHINNKFSHYSSKTGHILIDNVELEIGGQKIDKQYGEWLELWSQLTDDAAHQDLMSKMNSIDNSFDGRLYVPLRFWFCQNPGLALPLVSLQYHEVVLYLTLNGRAQLESDYIEYIRSLEAISSISTSASTDTAGTAIINALSALFSGNSLPSSTALTNAMALERITLFVNYIYLDTDERRRFAQQAHEYLITQIQQNSSNTVPAGGTKINIDLNFNHPVKQMVWSVKNIGNIGDNYFNYWNGNLPGPTENPYLSSSQNSTLKYGDQVKDALLLLNGTERFQSRRGAYFRMVQPYYYNSGASNFQAQDIFSGKAGMSMFVGQQTTSNLTSGSINDVYIRNRILQAGKNNQGGFYSFSFALNPEDPQPSGTCNFSRIDTATLILDLYPSNNGSLSTVSRSVNIYAQNYNILRIMNGMGGLAYAN